MNAYQRLMRRLEQQPYLGIIRGMSILVIFWLAYLILSVLTSSKFRWS